jgi:hypothetical protein
VIGGFGLWVRLLSSEAAMEIRIRGCRDRWREKCTLEVLLPDDHANDWRLHGPVTLIEYDNTQNNANHIHSIWHDLTNNWGRDLLREHYESGHAHA